MKKVADKSSAPVNCTYAVVATVVAWQYTGDMALFIGEVRKSRIKSISPTCSETTIGSVRIPNGLELTKGDWLVYNKDEKTATVVPNKLFVKHTQVQPEAAPVVKAVKAEIEEEIEVVTASEMFEKVLVQPEVEGDPVLASVDTEIKRIVFAEQAIEIVNNVALGKAARRNRLRALLGNEPIEEQIVIANSVNATLGRNAVHVPTILPETQSPVEHVGAIRNLERRQSARREGRQEHRSSPEAPSFTMNRRFSLSSQ